VILSTREGIAPTARSLIEEVGASTQRGRKDGSLSRNKKKKDRKEGTGEGWLGRRWRSRQDWQARLSPQEGKRRPPRQDLDNSETIKKNTSGGGYERRRNGRKINRLPGRCLVGTTTHMGGGGGGVGLAGVRVTITSIKIRKRRQR